MTRASALLVGVWEFVVGDDWRTALGVVVALALTALIAAVGISAWWVMPIGVLGLLTLSIRRAVRAAPHAEDEHNRGSPSRPRSGVGGSTA
jgi:hypothetical protein